MNDLADDPDFIASGPGKTLRESPLRFTDVGARGGAHPVVEPIAKLTSVLGFEPDEAACKEILNAPNPWADLTIKTTALGSSRGTRTIHRLASPTNDSLLPPNEIITSRYAMEKFREVGRASVALGTLDDETQIDPHGEIIKLDVQGTELDVLSGSRRTLEVDTVAVISEVEFVQIYEGQRLFSDVEKMLRDVGFSFYGFHGGIHYRSKKKIDKRTERGRERALWADAIFFKDPLDGRRQFFSTRQYHVLYCAALLLEYYDFALELARCWGNSDEEEMRRAESVVRRRASNPPGKNADDARMLCQEIELAPNNASVLVGKFIDSRAGFGNFDDVASEP